MSRITHRIPTSIRIPTRQPSRQKPQPIQLLLIQLPIVPSLATLVRALAAQVVVVAEFLAAQPEDCGFEGVDGRVDALGEGVAVD